MPGISEEDIRSAVWWHRSGVNVKTVVCLTEDPYNPVYVSELPDEIAARKRTYNIFLNFGLSTIHFVKGPSTFGIKSNILGRIYANHGFGDLYLRKMTDQKRNKKLKSKLQLILVVNPQLQREHQ